MEAKLVKTSDEMALQVPSTAISRCAEVVKIFWRLRNSPAYQHFCDQGASPEECFAPGNTGVCMGYDFHVRDGQIHLIEINTNAAGMKELGTSQGIQKKILNMFRSEYQAFKPGTPLSSIAIVDHNPPHQLFYPEFEYYQKIFEAIGIRSVICDPSELSLDSVGRLGVQDMPVDMVYLRLTDFYLTSLSSETLKTAYLNKAVCVSPTPREFHLLANKNRFVQFCDRQHLLKFGLSESDADQLGAVVPKTHMMQDQDVGYWMDRRKEYVFKLPDKFGSRGVFLGSTLTRRKLENLYVEPRIAQQFVPPGEVQALDGRTQLKFDIRLLTYQDTVLGVIARLYTGLLTNLQSPQSMVISVTTSE